MGKRLPGGRKNRWGGLLGPSVWVCRNESCDRVRQEIKLDYAASYGTCESCGKSLYRVRDAG